MLMFCPLGSPQRHVGTIAFASHHAFFEAELLGMNEVSHRVVVDFQPRSASSVTSPHRGDIVDPDPLRQPDWVFPEIALGL